jgi:hypothetical protein
MFRSKILLFTVLGCFVLCAVGQETPKPTLIDDHEAIPCDETLGRIDAFFSELSRFPDNSGLIVLSAPPAAKSWLIFRQTIIEHQANWRSFDSSRFQIIRARSQRELRVQFWRIPPGTNSPSILDVDMSYDIPKTVPPFLMGDETRMGDQICPEVNDGEIFAKFLKENRGARGNIVIRDNSPTRGRQKAARMKRNFELKYGIAASRLRTFTAKLTRPSNHDEAIVEYWYLP